MRPRPLPTAHLRTQDSSDEQADIGLNPVSVAGITQLPSTVQLRLLYVADAAAAAAAGSAGSRTTWYAFPPSHQAGCVAITRFSVDLSSFP